MQEEDQEQCAHQKPLACVFCVNYCQHCLPCPEGLEIGWVIWDLDQIPARGIEQVREWYAEFPVKASACVKRCPSDVEIIGKMREAAALLETEAA
jgi:predicted aldo/keto reductase-like oxidoreductase